MPDRFCIHNDVSIPSIRFLRAVVRRMLGKQAKKQSAAASALLHKRKNGIAGRCRRCFWRFPASCAARMFRTLTSSTCRHLYVCPENAAAAQPAAFRRGNRTPNDVTNRLSSAFCRADDIITDVAGGVGVDVLMLTADHLALGVLVVRKRNGLAHHCGHVFFIDRHPQRREKLRVA